MENLAPKQKADELIDKYYNLFAVDLENTISKYEAVYCAIIAVRQIITANPHSNPLNTKQTSTMRYWNEVLTELKSRL